MDRILFLDSYYPQVFKAKATFFGTADYYSEAFNGYGWAAMDLIVNDPSVSRAMAHEQIAKFKPNVIYCQDLSWLQPDEIEFYKMEGIKVVGQISSQLPSDDVVKNYQILFTSFPHYLKKFRELGVRGEFLQIGFGGQRVIDAAIQGGQPERDIDIGFVGGLGGGRTQGFWESGTKLFCDIAEHYPEKFKWWGYASDDTLRAHPTLARCYQGEAWGLDMYKIYSRCKMVVNRHGEVAQAYSNNMRLFEATGMGALMLTEESYNIEQYFQPWYECAVYKDFDSLNMKLAYYLKNEKIVEEMAKAGRARTMRDHIYDKVLIKVHRVLKGIE